MYSCDNIYVPSKQFEIESRCFNGFVQKKRKTQIFLEGGFLTFNNDNLKSLGVTDEYVDYYFTKYLKSLDNVWAAKVNLKYDPESVRYQDVLECCKTEANFLKTRLIAMYRSSVLRVKYPEVCRNDPLYMWMCFYDDFWDSPDVKEYKMYPEISCTKGKSYLYYCDYNKYLYYKKKCPFSLKISEKEILEKYVE